MPQQLPLQAIFSALDRKDLGTFLNYLSPSCRFQYGNRSAVEGHDAIREIVGKFLEEIAESHHAIKERWQIDDSVICHGEVAYTRRDGKKITAASAHILILDEGVIRDYRVYVDMSPLYARPLEET
jgi:ketosteroid isomerase-like protein